VAVLTGHTEPQRVRSRGLFQCCAVLSFTNDHFEIERAALANAPNLDHRRAARARLSEGFPREALVESLARREGGRLALSFLAAFQLVISESA
jgi:hypothetical protein